MLNKEDFIYEKKLLVLLVCLTVFVLCTVGCGNVMASDYIAIWNDGKQYYKLGIGTSSRHFKTYIIRYKLKQKRCFSEFF